MEPIRGDIYKERGSTFHGFYLQPQNISEFNDALTDLRAEFPDAHHFCWAYRIRENTSGDQLCLFDDKTLREKYSNDGEPSGVGMAMLNLLAGLENVAVIVVRYWGGELLGAYNLIQAYKRAAKSAVRVN
ncbi:MAG: YigZ family protein [Firmicutes bacterium]|nr:YigZ family protein [Bacillota bacterium]